MDSVWQYFIAAGWLLYPLTATIFFIWFLYLSLLVELRNKLQTPDPCNLEIRALPISESEFGNTQKELQNEPGLVPRLLLDVMTRMRQGISFREAFMQSRHAATSRYTYCFYMLGALVTAAPLLGLLGTVLGMIQTFRVVGGHSAQTATQIAEGISQALITTQMGLVAALPGTFGLVHLYRLYRRLNNTIDQCESHLALIYEH